MLVGTDSVTDGTDSTDSADSVATLRSAHTPRTATRDTTSTLRWKLPPQCPCPAGRRRTHWYLNRRALKGIREQDSPGFHRELGPSNTGRGAAKAWRLGRQGNKVRVTLAGMGESTPPDP